MSAGAFRFSTRMRVRWAEVDSQKIVFNGHYLTYFDAATSDYYRAIGIPYPEAFDTLGGDLFVRKSTLEYHASARYDDVLSVAVRCAGVGRTSITFAWAVSRAENVLVTGETVYVFADPATQTKKEVPAALRDAFTAYDAGTSTICVLISDFATVSADARALRKSVFVDERGIREEDEWDADDETAVHAIAYGPLGHTLATGRLTTHAPGIARIGRMAVTPRMRGSGLGRRVLDALIDVARARGDGAVVLHAVLDVAPFYAMAGFTSVGEPFEEAGLSHITMTRAL
jgi:YbgC/YbaW family acyl-CoA thioester hydrolase